MLLTMLTPWGRFRWTRLPFGISSTPEEFQRRIHDVLSGIEGVVNIPDDFIVMGWGPSNAAAKVDHDRTVLELLERLSHRNLKLNPDKVKFNTCTAPFIGHVLTEIVNAVLNMPQSCEKGATGRFLGTIVYLSKFCPHLSDIVRPLLLLLDLRSYSNPADLRSYSNPARVFVG